MQAAHVPRGIGYCNLAFLHVRIHLLQRIYSRLESVSGDLVLVDDALGCVSCFVEIDSLTSNCVASGRFFEPYRYGRFRAKVRGPKFYVRILLNLKWMKDFVFYM